MLPPFFFTGEPSWSIRTLHTPDENEQPKHLSTDIYQNAVRGLFRLSQTVPLDNETAHELVKFDYKRMINMMTRTGFNRIDLDPVRFFANVSKTLNSWFPFHF